MSKTLCTTRIPRDGIAIISSLEQQGTRACSLGSRGPEKRMQPRHGPPQSRPRPVSHPVAMRAFMTSKLFCLSSISLCTLSCGVGVLLSAELDLTPRAGAYHPRLDIDDCCCYVTNGVYKHHSIQRVSVSAFTKQTHAREISQTEFRSSSA